MVGISGRGACHRLIHGVAMAAVVIPMTLLAGCAQPPPPAQPVVYQPPPPPAPPPVPAARG